MSRSPSMAQVYIFEAETGLIKIGYTNNPEQRVRKIQTYSGFKIKRQSVSPLCFNHREIELALHKQFAEYRRQGEWFAMDFQVAVDALNQQKFETSSAPSTQLVAFHFLEQKVRVFLDEKGEPLFCLKDVCNVLEIKNSRNVIKRLNKNGVRLIDIECDVHPVDITSTKDECDVHLVEVTSKARKTQTMSFINEPNLYRVIFRSDKLVAVQFQDWVFEEVLPTIRKTGKYEVNPPLPALTRRPEYQDFDNFVAECFIADSAGLVAARDIYTAYKEWCQRHQRTLYTHKM